MAKKSYTTKQVMAGFGVSDMTVFTWRKGTPTKEPLPHTVEGRKVEFPATDLKAWAKKHGLKFDMAAADGTGGTEKPGPKAGPAKKVAKKETAEA